MKTQGKAMRQLEAMGGKGYIYEFERGHWSYATEDSPIARDLEKSGMIYPEINVKAKTIIKID